MSEQRCPVARPYRSDEPTYDGVCGLPLELTGGPCVTCGFATETNIHGRAGTFIGLVERHPYQPPLACPVHGEQR